MRERLASSRRDCDARRVARERLDKLMVDRGLAASRERARALVMSGAVLVGGQPETKPGTLLDAGVEIVLREADHPYVSRGALKLVKGLDAFAIDPTGLTCLDIGASTGGFTDCLLQHGARPVVAVDVGHNQFDWRLRNDPRIELREGVNARYLKPEDFDRKFDLATIDVAFISATKILPAVVPLLVERGKIITLIKPQFEVGKGEVGKGGIIKDPAKHERVIAEVNRSAEQLGLKVSGVIESPIHGADGNVEFLALYELR